MKAEAVLGCVSFALLYEDWLEGPNRPCFADAVTVAQDLINQTVQRLGSGEFAEGFRTLGAEAESLSGQTME